MTDDVRHGDDAAAAYEAAKLSYIRAVTADAEGRLRDAYVRRRAMLAGEIDDLRELAKRRQDAADAAAAAYATKLPHRVRKNGVRPPSIWERIASGGGAVHAYRDAAKASAELDDVHELLRSRRERLDVIERETRRSISMREEAVRRKLQTPEGLAALHDDPLVRTAFAKMQTAANERAKAERRAPLAGETSPEAARDRAMAERGLAYARVPLQAVMIAGVLRFGHLAYYVLRDLGGREQLLSCDPALEPLRDYVFDLTHSDLGYEASLRHTTADVPMRVLDHLKTTMAGADATAAYALHRGALRTERPSAVTPPIDAIEDEMLAMLRLLAQAVATHGSSESDAAEA